MLAFWLIPLGVVAGLALYLSRTGRPGPVSTDGSVPVKLRLTGYWPFTAQDSERKMEGGKHDRLGHPLYTVEDYLAGRAPYVSLSGDDSVWPYGQRIVIPWFDKQIVGRVVDTGDHFRGANKTIHNSGYEPIDVCVLSRDTQVPKLVTGAVFEGDTLRGGSAVADRRGSIDYSRLGKGQTAVAGLLFPSWSDGSDDEDLF